MCAAALCYRNNCTHIEERLQTLKTEIEQKTSAALSMECTEDTVKNIKKIRAELTKELNGYETRRKYVKAQIEAPYKAFNAIYLCAILDLYSRKVISYKLSSKIDTQLAIETVNLAVASRAKSEGIIFHTDRGCQFTSEKFRKHPDSLNMVQSFSAKGHPYDNAVMECFFKYLKKEETDRNSYHSFHHLNLCLFEYINGFYNSVRPHSHNNGLSPNQVELYFFS